MHLPRLEVCSSTQGGLTLGKGDWVAASDIRRETKPPVYEVLLDAEELGWRIRRQGHKFRIYCPCGGETGTTIRVDGTPRNADSHSERVRREMRHCPDRHDLDG